MKYMLVKVVERNIFPPIFYNNLLEAQTEMVKQLAAECRIKWEDIADHPIKDIIEAIEEYSEDVGFFNGNHGAYVSEGSYGNYDWEIFEVDEECKATYIERNEGQL